MSNKSVSRNYTQAYAEIHFSDSKRIQAIEKLNISEDEFRMMFQTFRAKSAHDLCDSLFGVLETVTKTKGKVSKNDMKDFQTLYNGLKEFDV